jgi:hypothetical protein
MSKLLLEDIRIINRALECLCDRNSEVKESNYSIAEAIANTPRVNEYIGSLCRQLHKIYSRHDLSTAEMEPETNKTGMGQVQSSDIAAVLKEGNLRERMALLTNIAGGSKTFLWRIIQEKNNADLNPAVLQSRIHRAYLMTGVRDVAELMPPGKEMLDILHDGPVLLSRFHALHDPLRSERPKQDHPAHLIPIDRVTPPLSTREIGYIKKHNPCWNDRRHVPWENGLMVWIINPDNFYSRLANRHSQKTISGPSSTTDRVLQLAELFNNFDIDLAVLACAAFLCGANHHSAWEVLLAALPFGLRYSSDVDAYAYIHQHCLDLV